MSNGLINLRKNNCKNVIFSYLNINSIRNKLDDLRVVVAPNVDILCIGESKLDDTFKSGTLNLEGFSPPFRLDKSSKSGGILTYIRSSLPSRLISSYKLPDTIQAIPVEVNLRKEKWLVF